MFFFLVTYTRVARKQFLTAGWLDLEAPGATGPTTPLLLCVHSRMSLEFKLPLGCLVGE